MRFKISFNCMPGQLLPLNYQYELASWVYKTINRSDVGFSEWLHSQGHRVEGKTFKLFTFSNLTLPAYRLQGDRLWLLGDTLSVQLSFAVTVSAEHFIKGVFQNQHLTLGDKQSRVALTVQGVEAVTAPVFQSDGFVRFRTVSPICVSTSRLQKGRPMPLYHSPAEAGFSTLLLQNLLYKYEAASSLLLPPLPPAVAASFNFRLLTEPKSRLVTIKANTPQETKVRGYLFDFELAGPEALLQLGYAAGFGEKNSLGFGCVEVIG